jgi:hypothetical protein
MPQLTYWNPGTKRREVEKALARAYDLLSEICEYHDEQENYDFHWNGLEEDLPEQFYLKCKDIGVCLSGHDVYVALPQDYDKVDSLTSLFELVDYNIGLICENPSDPECPVTTGTSADPVYVLRPGFLEYLNNWNAETEKSFLELKAAQK